MAALGEFELIARFFTHPGAERQGVGDDCALIDAGEQTLALTSDMLIEEVHFFSDVDPLDLGHKSLAVNLSDLAAAGARPRCFLLDLALPAADERWLTAFSEGLMALARAQSCSLVGGDTVRSAPVQAAPGPVVVAITAVGELDRRALRGRAGARPGDDIWVSGRLGEPALALAWRRAQRGLGALPATGFDWRADGVHAAFLRRCALRMDRPQPRVALGLALRGLASAAIDISDGLLGDLGHVLERSEVGAELHCAEVPMAPELRELDESLRWPLVLAGGDEYELLFTAGPQKRAAVASLSSEELPLTRIGTITAARGLCLLGAHGERSPLGATLQSFDHFRSPST